MSYATARASELAAKPGPHPAASAYDKGVGEALGIAAFGVYEVELPPRAETVPHDHRADRAEDVYAAIAGSGVVVVDGGEVPSEPGCFAAVAPDSARHVRAGGEGPSFIAFALRDEHTPTRE